MLGKIEGRKRSWGAENEMVGCITDSVDMSLSKLREIVKDRKAWHAAIHGVTVKHNLATKQLIKMLLFL